MYIIAITYNYLRLAITLNERERRRLSLNSDNLL